MFCALFSGSGALALYFQIPFSRYVSTHFFQLSTFFCTSFFNVPSSIYIQV